MKYLFNKLICLIYGHDVIIRSYEIDWIQNVENIKYTLEYRISPICHRCGKKIWFPSEYPIKSNTLPRKCS